MKTFALGIALGASLVSTAAFAEQQRPTYLAFSAPAVTAPVNAVAAPALPKVGKRANAFLSVPLVLPLLGLVAVIGGIVAASTGGGNSSPG
jgi:hypothetical protein